MKNIFSGLLITVFAALLLIGCKTDENSPTAPPVAQTASAMVVHTSPDAPGVDLYVDNNLAKTNLSYPEATPYLSLSAGTRNVKVKVTGTSTTVIDANLVLTPNASYSVFAVDSVSRLSTLVTVDTLTTPATGKSHVRFIHLSPNAPAVDVALQGGAVLFGNTQFKQYSSFTPVSAGTYNLEVRIAGTTTVVLPLPNITLVQGKIYTVFAKGFVGGIGTKALGAGIILNN
jgi:hypothetical protein